MGKHRMLDAGLRAVLTCVDPKQLDKMFVGREFDAHLLAELPAGVDPCGERGEFHTLCYRCPEFNTELPHLIVNDHRAFLTFYVREPDPDWDAATSP